MSAEQLESFLANVQTDTRLQEELSASTDAYVVVAIAKDAGFFISVDDLENAKTMLSEEELGVVAGGLDAVEGAGISNNSWIVGKSPTLPIFMSIPGGAVDQQRSK